ncbi:MAG: hypothetical protein EPO12_01755 [Aquabacterium sp.]|nr:MAG: hypothetical protein EPO12_01755 [Aquabacterium sp.]
MISSCLIGLTFLPQAGADYEALVTPDDNGCRLALTRLEQQGATIARDPVPFSRIRTKCE